MPNPNRMRRRLGGNRPQVKAAHFVAASVQKMSLADNAALSMGAGVHPTFCFWVYPEAQSGNVLAKDAGVAASGEYRFALNGSAGIQVQFSNGTAYTATQSAASILTRAWSFVVIQYDGANQQVSINNGAFAQTANSGDIQDGANAFTLATRSDNNSFFTGALNEVGMAKSVLSANELTELYNAGRGRKFAELSPALAAKFTAYWDLDDAGGSGATWLDKASTNHLTAGTGTAAPTAVLLPR